MSEYPSVARVLLVAAPARQRELAPWLRVVGQPVRYDLELVEPSAAEARPDPWDVIVIDGGSIASDAERESLLRRMSAQSFASLLYLVAERSASDPGVERDQAFTWASDTLWPGWELGDRLRRRVQEIALAPWRRSMALRVQAERLGDRRLRVIRPVYACDEHQEAPTARIRRLDRALPFVIAEKASKLGRAVPALVASAFHEGRRVGVASVRESAEGFCRMLLEELSRSLKTTPPEVLREMEASLRASTGSPLVAARYSGASYAIGVVESELRRLAREELAAIDRHEARPIYEP